MVKKRINDVQKWFAELDRLKGERVALAPRKQPKTPRRKVFR